MAFTQPQLDALEAAIATGTLKVQYQDKSVTYASLKDMLALRQIMKQELAGASATPRASRTAFSRD